jgi:hypothetical protein
VANPVRDSAILEEARRTAFDLVDSNQLDSEAYAPLKGRVLERFGGLFDLPQGG